MIAPLSTAIVEVEHGIAPSRVDRQNLALVPAGVAYRLRPSGPTGDVAILGFGSAAFARAAGDYRGFVKSARFAELLARPQLLPRTRWVDELVHRYVFERITCGKHESRAATFLEVELTKELYVLCEERLLARTRATVLEAGNDLVARARAILDEDPFHAPSIAALAARCHTSESTLLRAFRRELACSPITYVRDRRLDAALPLVQARQLTVSEIATRAGYGNLAAFTTAFRRRFGAPPTAVRRQDDGLARLPPHGLPLRRPRAKH